MILVCLACSWRLQVLRAGAGASPPVGLDVAAAGLTPLCHLHLVEASSATLFSKFPLSLSKQVSGPSPPQGQGKQAPEEEEHWSLGLSSRLPQ